MFRAGHVPPDPGRQRRREPAGSAASIARTCSCRHRTRARLKRRGSRRPLGYGRPVTSAGRVQLLIASTLAVVVSGLSTPAVAETSEARSAPGDAITTLRVTVPCSGGPGRIAVRAERSSDGGTSVAARLRGLRNDNWFGGIYVDPDGPASNRYKAEDGKFDDSLTSSHPWGNAAQGYYTSSDSQVLCFAGGTDTGRRLHAGSDYLIVYGQAAERRLRVFFSILPSHSRWSIRVRMTRASGRTTALQQLVEANDSGNGTADFHELRGLARSTRIVVHGHRIGHPDDELNLLIRRS